MHGGFDGDTSASIRVPHWYLVRSINPVESGSDPKNLWLKHGSDDGSRMIRVSHSPLKTSCTVGADTPKASLKMTSILCRRMG
jgi:hypothetical protein